MKIFEDIMITDGDKEILSDSFPITEVDGVVYEADCAMIEIGAVNVDTGANASAEEAAEDVDDSAQKVNNILHSFNYQATAFDKKSYTAYMKGYMGGVAKKMAEMGKTPEEVADFKAKAAPMFKKILGNFKDYEFYTGPSGDPDGMVILLNYREDGVTPYVTVWKHGLKEVKV